MTRFSFRNNQCQLVSRTSSLLPISCILIDGTNISKKTIIAVENDQESDFCDGGKVVVETIHCLTGKPGDLSLYQSVKRSTKDSENEEKKLSPLKEISRSRTMISTVKGHHKDVLNFESELTFTPKLNALSIKLAKARGEKIRNSALNRRSSYQNAEEDAIFTFKPQVSSNSEKIVQKLKTTFLDRQMLHVEKQKRHIQSDSYLLPYKSSRLSPVQMIKSKKHKTSKLKDLNDSIEEENEDKHNPTPSKDSLLTTSSDITNSMSNSSSTTDIECGTKRLNEDQQSNENQMDECDNSDENDNNSLENKKNTRNIKLECLNTGAQRLKEQSPYNQSSENLYLNKHKRSIRAHQRGLTYPVTKPKIENEDWNSSTKVDKKPNIPNGVKKGSHSRNASQPGQHCSKMKYDHPLFEKVRHAKEVADGAIKNKKVFICHGPYPIVRASLRRRGFVEKHYQSSPLIKKKARKKRQNADSDADSASSDDESDDNPTPNTTPRGKVNKSVSKSKETSPKESDNKKKYGGGSDDDSSDDDDDDDSEDEDWKAGYEAGGPDSEFNLMSRMVRNAVASFIWTVRRDDVDFKYLRKDQTVNHFSRAYSFTTKVGLCSNLRNLAFYEEVDPFTFFPRCHRLGVEEDKLDFIDDFRMNAALAIIKWVIARFENSSSASGTLQTNDEPSIGCEDKQKEDEPAVETTSGNILPVKALTSSLEACRDYLRRQEHLDVDDPLDTKPVISEVLWNEIINYSYQLRQSQTVIASAFPFLRECQNVVNKMKEHMPQIDIDGQRNIWIVKPGAKSRGRGIMCMDRLEDILKLTGNIIGQKEGRWVVQKYIERPLLIYGVKFDIRQWYLVTDWNPLTVWFYQDCYLRFCSQNFSLEDFHVSIHLANNSVQKNFENDKVRDKRLPEENMWSSDEFKSYLRKKGLDGKWSNVIYPGMKQAVIYAMESCQEIVEYRKNSFELYGADFIIGDDFKPWLIEINCSPTMGASTGVTRKLCAQVVEDTMKVVLDRREDRNCDTGRFELAFKQAHVSAPPYIGVNLAVEGQGIPRKASVTRRPSTSSKVTNVARPRDTTTNMNESKTTRTSIIESRDVKNNANESRNTRNSLNESREFKSIRDASRDRIISPNKAISQSSSSSETFQDKLDVKRHNHKTDKNPNLEPRNNIKKAEGSWALGQLQIPKRLRARSRSDTYGETKGQGQGVPKGAQPMSIPKAILRYSTDQRNEPQKPQIPISIGPSH